MVRSECDVSCGCDDCQRAYITDFWDTFDQETKDLLILDGWEPPTQCELIIVDFMSGLGEIARVMI